MDEWEIDPKGLYGLKPEFLKSLNIVPPIDKWVHVSNFRCDKSELRDIMELAGKVLSCSVFTVINKYANVQYSHPLEAVQAVSMLNDAMYYGQKLKVQLERSPSDTVFLPKGLTTVGQGLGVNGKPLRNIVKHYKKLLANEPSLLNPCVVNLPDGSVPKKTPEVHFEIKTLTTKTTTGVQKSKPVQTIANQNSTQNNNSPNVAAKPKNSPNAIPTVSRPQIQPKLNNANFRPSVPFNRGPRPMGPGPMGPGPMGPGPMGPGPMGPGPMGPGPMGPGPMGPGPMGPGSMGPSPIGPGPFGPRPMGPRTMGQYGNGWNGPGPMQGPMPGPGPMTPGPMMPGPMPVQNMGPFNSNEPVQLQLSNLPPSTTFAILCEKMAQCGQVVAIQLTTPGCAVVTFGNRMQADYCIKTYNGNYVDGHVIQIKYS